MKLAYGYIRVSTEKQAKEGTSMEAQQAAIQAYVDFKLKPQGFTFGGWFRDAAQSGAIHLRKRPEGFRLSMTADSGDCVVFAKLDRLTREVDLLRALAASSVDLVFCDLPSVPPGAKGRFLLTQMAAVAELEVGLIGERTKAAHH